MGIKCYIFFENNEKQMKIFSYPEEIVKQSLEKVLADPQSKVTGYMYLVPRKEEK